MSLDAMFRFRVIVSLYFYQILCANAQYNDMTSEMLSSYPIHTDYDGELQIHINRNTVFYGQYNNKYIYNYNFAPNELINAVCYKSHEYFQFEYLGNHYTIKKKAKNKQEFSMLLKPEQNMSSLECVYQGRDYYESITIYFFLNPKPEEHSIRVDGLFLRVNLGNTFILNYYGNDLNVTCNDKPAFLFSNKKNTIQHPVIDAVCDYGGIKTTVQLHKDVQNKDIHVSGLHLNKILGVAPCNSEKRILYEYFEGEIIQLNCTHNFSPEYWQLDDILRVGMGNVVEPSPIFNRRMKKNYHFSKIMCGYEHMQTIITFFNVEKISATVNQLETNQSSSSTSTPLSPSLPSSSSSSKRRPQLAIDHSQRRPNGYVESGQHPAASSDLGTVEDNYLIYVTSVTAVIIILLLIMAIFLLRRKQLQRRKDISLITDTHNENIGESSTKYLKLASDKNELKYVEIDFEGHGNNIGQNKIDKDLKSDIGYAEVFQNLHEFNEKMEELSKECIYMNEKNYVYENLDKGRPETSYCEVAQENYKS